MTTALKERPRARAKTKTSPVRHKPIKHEVEDAPPNMLVTFLLDRTQSMSKIKSATIESFNAYLAGLQKEPEGIAFTLLQFDSMGIDKLYVAHPVALVAPLTNETFQPRASTPLIDACVKTIRAVADSLLVRKDKPKVVVAFQTDGEENVSREHTWADLSDLIRLKTLEGWQFVFLGVGIDAYEQGRRMGIDVANTVATTHDPQQMHAAYASLSANTMSFGRGLSGSVGYTLQQKQASGDTFDPSLKQKLGRLDLGGKS